MRKLIIIPALLASSSALAQQAQEQPALNTYRELLAEANGRIVAMSVQLANVSKQLEEAKKAAKPEEEKK